MTLAADTSDIITEMVAAELGQEVVWNGSARLSGVLDDDFLAALGVETSGPSFVCRSADIASAAHGDTLDLEDGTRYLIRGIVADGTGVTVLRLEKQ